MLLKSDLDQLLQQHANGLISDFELLLKVQLHTEVVSRILAVQKLPYRAASKIIIDDLYNDDPRLEPGMFESSDPSGKF